VLLGQSYRVFGLEEGFILIQSDGEMMISRGKLKKYREKPAPVLLPPPRNSK
jgi:hypothetical protein